MTRDQDLEQRIGQVLAELSRLSEVGAAQIGRSSASSDEDRGLPAGIDQSARRRDPDRPPPKERSLYDYYAWHFARARTDAQRRVLLFLAETDLDQRLKTAPGQAERTASPEAIGATRDDRIINWYEGVPALQVAVLESAHAGYCSEANVLRVRELDRRDQDGHKLPGWAGWTDEERTKRVRELKSKRKSLAAIAAELGTTKASANRYLNGYRRRAA